MVHTDRAAVLIGVYYSSDQAEKALDELKRNGFREDQLRVTLCDADLADGSLAAPPRRKSATGIIAGMGLGGLGGGFLGVTGAGLLLGVSPVLAVFWAGFGIGVLAGAVLGSVLGACIKTSRWENEVLPPKKTMRLSRGIVTVRPQHRYTEAAAILRHFAGCDANPASPVGM